MASPTQSSGYDFESKALVYLEEKGLRLVVRQWRCRFGEIDLIMRHGATLVFVEVRQRRSAAFGGARESLTASKLAKLERAASMYLAASRFDGPCRFDAVLVGATDVTEWIQSINS